MNPFIAGCLALFGSGVSGLLAQESAAAARPDSAQSAPSGARAQLAARGVTARMGLTNDVTNIALGGVRRGTATRALVAAVVEADLEKLMGWRGAQVRGWYAAQRGENGSAFAGDAQAFSNIDVPDRFGRVYELWLQQSFGNRLRVKAGRVDANTEFAVVGAAGNFINTSAGFSPTITGFPTYPQPHAAVAAFARVASFFEVGAGYFGGTFASVDGPDGTAVEDRFAIVQTTTRWVGGNLQVGGWRHSGVAVRYNGELLERPRDWYAAIEQRVAGKEAAEATPSRSLSVFAKYGHAPGAIAAIERHVMGGAVWSGVFRPTVGDQLGVGVTKAAMSSDPAAGFAGDETAFEVFYRTPVLRLFVVRPDVQYILHPSGNMDIKPTLAATLRVDVNY